MKKRLSKFYLLGKQALEVNVLYDDTKECIIERHIYLANEEGGEDLTELFENKLSNVFDFIIKNINWNEDVNK